MEDNNVKMLKNSIVGIIENPQQQLKTVLQSCQDKDEIVIVLGSLVRDLSIANLKFSEFKILAKEIVKQNKKRKHDQ